MRDPLFIQMAKNIHDGCLNCFHDGIIDCTVCHLYDEEKYRCPFEYIFGSMPCDWVFGGDDNA